MEGRGEGVWRERECEEGGSVRRERECEEGV